MYYTQSGRYSPGGLLMGAAIGIAGSAILAFAYGRGLILISDAHFAAFTTIAFGAAVGAACGYGSILGNVRNNRAAIAVSTFVAVFALYLSWAVWVAATLQSEPFVSDASWSDLALHPDALWRAICMINQYGTWGLGDDAKVAATHGTELWAIWIAEAATIIGVAPSVGSYVLRLRPFCEACECWAERGARFQRATPANLAQMKRHLESKDLEPLTQLAMANKENDLSIALNSCPRCRLFHTLSITHTVVTRRKWRRPIMNRKEIMRHLIVRPEHAETIRLLSAGGTSASRNGVPGIDSAKVTSAAVGKK